MTEHTKEPWRVVNCDAVPSDGENGLRLIEIRAGEVFKSPNKHNVAGYIDCGGKFVAHCNTRADLEAEANARRIVDCVNALAGLNPSGVAALIEAAEGLASDVQCLVDCREDCGEWGAECPLQDAPKPDGTIERLQKLLDALANIRGRGNDPRP